MGFSGCYSSMDEGLSGCALWCLVAKSCLNCASVLKGYSWDSCLGDACGPRCTEAPACPKEVPSPWHQVLSKHVAQRQSMPRVVGVTLKWNGLQMLQKRGGRGQIKKHKCCWPGWWQWQPLSQQWSTGVFAKATYLRLPTFITDYGHQIVSLSLGFL